MILFADSETTTWFMVMGVVITTLGAFGASVMAYLNTLAKFRFDAELLMLKGDVRNLTKLVEECEKDKDENKIRANDTADRMSKAETKAARIEGELAGTERQVKDLQTEVNDLRDRLNERSS